MSQFLVSLTLTLVLCAGGALRAQVATYSVERRPAGDAFALRLENTVPIRGGTAVFSVDPAVFTITGVSRGADGASRPADRPLVLWVSPQRAVDGEGTLRGTDENGLRGRDSPEGTGLRRAAR
ncbi:MAG: hypothetical protein O7J95_08895 [Planctomycetota bacterium]|nr:hypothetical protein [Planctomycetota bacterium]